MKIDKKIELLINGWYESSYKQFFPLEPSNVAKKVSCTDKTNLNTPTRILLTLQENEIR